MGGDKQDRLATVAIVLSILSRFDRIETSNARMEIIKATVAFMSVRFGLRNAAPLGVITVLSSTGWAFPSNVRSSDPFSSVIPRK